MHLLDFRCGDAPGLQPGLVNLIGTIKCCPLGLEREPTHAGRHSIFRRVSRCAQSPVRQPRNYLDDAPADCYSRHLSRTSVPFCRVSVSLFPFSQPLPGSIEEVTHSPIASLKTA
jgi:hypothetical protein